MPSSSIIIPVHNRAALTRQCLNALLEHPYRDGKPEIIVVDDASTDLTLRLLSSYGDFIKVIHHASNQGFGNACNAGAAASSGDNLVFLNNDTLPQPGWLDALVAYSLEHPAAGAVGSKLLFANDTIQHAGVVICQDGFPRHLYAGFPADHPAVNRSRPFKIVTGACVLLPRARFFEANGFDPSFRNGYEDVDLCLRLGELGYEVRYCHESVLYHFEYATRGPTNVHIEHNVKAYIDRWIARVVPDDLDYYIEDDLLKVAYKDGYPVVLEVSPYLATVQTAGDELTMERLLNYRSDQVGRLLRELAARTSDVTLTELTTRVTTPSPAKGPVVVIEPAAASQTGVPPVAFQDIIVTRQQEQDAATTSSESPGVFVSHDHDPVGLSGSDPRVTRVTWVQGADPVQLVAPGRRHTLVGGSEGILVSVLIPVKNGAEQLLAQLPKILRQRAAAQVEIIAVDSGSSDDTIEILTDFGATVFAIAPSTFNHGLTRNLLANHSHGEVLVFLNQTAMPVNDYWLANLIEPLKVNSRLAGVCSRVVPHPDADPLVYREVVNDPSGSTERAIRGIENSQEFHRLDPHERRLRLNFHTVSAAVRRRILDLIPFRPVRVMSEDTQWAKEVMLAGYQLQHEPTSMVYHSHAYSLSELFQRNVDDGAANLDIVGRRLDQDQVMPAAWAQALEDSESLQDEFGVVGDELLELQLLAFLRRTVQFAGQWVGSNDDRLDASLLPALSRVARMKRTSASNGEQIAMKRRQPLPPPDLRFRVTGSRDAEWFEQSGRMAVEDFAAALAKHGIQLRDFKAIYDFGCGCGRLLRHLVENVEAQRLSGSDIDEGAIKWVQTHMPLVDARVTAHLPPLTFTSGVFDLVLGYSVFTHLDEAFQDSWLSELHRVTAPGAWLLLTVHGEAAWQAGASALGNKAKMLNEERQQKGFVHWRGDGWEEHFPDYYHTSWHTPSYVRGHWSRWFTVMDVLENQARPSHDLVILRRA